MVTVGLSYPQFHFWWFQLPAVNHSMKIVENFRTKQFMSFKVMKSRDVSSAPPGRELPLCLACNPDYGHLAAIVIRSAVTVSVLCSSDTCFTYSWPQSARGVMLVIRKCQREALKF